MVLIIIHRRALVKTVAKEEILIKEKNNQIKEKTVKKACVRAKKFLKKTKCITIDILLQLK
jgi:hypothetical protein